MTTMVGVVGTRRDLVEGDAAATEAVAEVVVEEVVVVVVAVAVAVAVATLATTTGRLLRRRMPALS